MKINLTIDFLEADKTKNLQVVTFNGDFDKVGFSDIKDKITDFVKAFELKSMIFDFTNLKYINSEGIGYLMEVHTHLIQRDHKLVIVGLNPNVKDVFSAIGIMEIVPVFATVEDYLSSENK